MAIGSSSSEANGDDINGSGHVNTPRSTSSFDSFDPFFLHNSDVPGVNLAHCVLTGTENYTLWSKSMRIALLGKNKIGFVDGTCRKDMYEGQMIHQWERVNAIVLSWIMSVVAKDLVNGIMYSSKAHKVWADLKERFDKVNATKIYHIHRGIVTLTQGTSTISVYFSRLSELWEEYESLVPPPSCSCAKSREFINNLEQQKLMQFLGGLNENYNQSRSQILTMPSIPSVNQAYSLIIPEESQRAHLNVVAQSSHSIPHYEEGESSALAAVAMSRYALNSKQKSVVTSHYEEGESSNSAAAANDIYSRTNTNMRVKKNFNLQCEFCHLKGHTRDKCYKLIGYPPDFKFTRNKDIEDNGFRGGNFNRGQNGYSGYRTGGYSAHNAHHESSHNHQVNAPQSKEQGFTAEKFQKLLTLIDKQDSPENVANRDLYTGKVKGIGKVKDGLYILSTKSPSPTTTSSLQSVSACHSTHSSGVKSSI
ncbi:hypothetical protein KY290_010622 [Solanum tuberosum]|uniref:Retrotransposon Copia-like N-terminal domain-containing protein n=1 Tax=Solanum tuberosum TaxID=4113 RepID=A0ABQ7VYB6_SOLTU|nr:hypothetical protein KY290_010622 [Solanum tuberosum]